MTSHTNLLDDYTPLSSQGIFAATLNAHGLYNNLQFVLRLSPTVHRKLASMPSGIITSGEVDIEGVRAFSTYLHETVHWWQHIGSTYGLMLSMTYPAQAHANYDHLKNLISQVGFKKSVRALAECLSTDGIGSPGSTANIIINNHFDMESFRALTVSPFSSDRIMQNPLFESLGHSYMIAYGNIIHVLSSVSDRNFKVIPHPEEWNEPFRKLRDAEEEGYYYGSPVSLYPIGAYEIFEGQARMAQLQYLHFSTGGLFDLDYADKENMFGGVYGKALSAFLQLTELQRPSSIDDPITGLFLLICDLSINPGSGFPFPLVHFSTFIRDVDPGARFVSLCILARLNHPEVFGAIRHYSREEYEAVSEKLCSAFIEESPLRIAHKFYDWCRTPEFRPLMEEHETFKFGNGNVATRILFSHFLAFMKDKYARPEFFCWPGAWMAGRRVSSEVMTLFDRHGALFLDKEDDDGVYPRLLTGRSDDDVQEAFDNFYASNVVYDLTRQWITEPGSFKYNYGWLSQKGSKQEIQAFAERCFEGIYGHRPSDVALVS